LCFVLLASTACTADPPARYAADLSPCALLPDKTARSSVGVQLPAGRDKGPQEFLGLSIRNRYCEWKYKAAEHPYRRVVPYKRELTVGLVVFPAKDGGSEAAAKDVRERHDPGQQAVTGIGQQAWWLTSDRGWATGTIVFRRDNAVVSVDLTGYDCCRTGGLGTDLPSQRLREVVTSLARTVDASLQAR
jgi:hypothetical protein